MHRGSSVSVRRPRRAFSLVGGAGILVLALTGCAPDPQHTAPPPTADPPQATAAPTDAEAAMDADAALESFAAVTARVWASDARDHGRAYVDALEQAGFGRDDMQVTADRSTVGNPAESLQFSVAWSRTQCLVGQVGPSTGEPVTALMPRLADGACLIGRTRPIDW